MCFRGFWARGFVALKARVARDPQLDISTNRNDLSLRVFEHPQRLRDPNPINLEFDSGQPEQRRKLDTELFLKYIKLVDVWVVDG
jgi:hypothetical protein